MSSSTPNSSSGSGSGSKFVFPYKPGFKVTIQRHIPPHPFGGVYNYPVNRPRHERADEKTSPVEWYMMNPPIETAPPPHPCSCEMEIIDRFTDEFHHSPHLVRCRLNGDDQIYVAKIYDGHYGFIDRPPRKARDLCYDTDSDYACESLAYETLRREGVDGQLAPRYYGSWTFSIPLESPQPDNTHSSSVESGLATASKQQSRQTILRPVRMILMEWVPGRDLADIFNSGDIDYITTEQRLDLLAQIMEIQTRLVYHYVIHDDLAPRNVMVTGLPEGGLRKLSGLPNPPDKQKYGDAHSNTHGPLNLRAVFIDFNRSYVTSSPYYTGLHVPRKALPVNPIDICCDSQPALFGPLVPKNYWRDISLFNGWLKKRWGKAKDFEKPKMLGFDYKYAEPDNSIPSHVERIFL